MKADFYMIAPRKVDMVIPQSAFKANQQNMIINLPGVAVQILVERLRLLGDLTTETVASDWTLNELYNMSYYTSGRTEV